MLRRTNFALSKYVQLPRQRYYSKRYPETVPPNEESSTIEPHQPSNPTQPTQLQNIATTTFNYFSKLPFEMQGMIWDCAAQEGTPKNRVLRLEHAEPPALLRVCHESRSRALKIYKKIEFLWDGEFRNRYIHPTRDAIYIKQSIGFMGPLLWQDFWHHPKDYVNGVQHVVFHYDAFIMLLCGINEKDALFEIDSLRYITVLENTVEVVDGLVIQDEPSPPAVLPHEYCAFWTLNDWLWWLERIHGWRWDGIVKPEMYTLMRPPEYDQDDENIEA